jgi:hypothetical protein
MKLNHSLLVIIWCIPWLEVMDCALVFRALTPRSFARRRQGVDVANRFYTYTASKMPLELLAAAQQTADAWAEGKNAAPAIMCEVENVPLLDSIPDG